jgi:hypothetical protein
MEKSRCFKNPRRRTREPGPVHQICTRLNVEVEGLGRALEEGKEQKEEEEEEEDDGRKNDKKKKQEKKQRIFVHKSEQSTK